MELRAGVGAEMNGKPDATIADSSRSSLATCARSVPLAARSPAALASAEDGTRAEAPRSMTSCSDWVTPNFSS
jgi:hypothetical protein